MYRQVDRVAPIRSGVQTIKRADDGPVNNVPSLFASRTDIVMSVSLKEYSTKTFSLQDMAAMTIVRTYMTIIRDFRQLHNQYELLSVAFLSFSDFQFVLKKTLLT